MKRTDVIIAMALGILASIIAIWLAQPQWYTNLAGEIREWREPRRSFMNRYADRDRMRREEQEANDQRERVSSSVADTRDRQDASARTITFAVVDAATNQPVTSFRYRRYFLARRPNDPPQDMPWNSVSNNHGTFDLTAERTYEPIERPRDQAVAQTEIWKSVIEDEMQKRWAQSDTLDVEADGYTNGSVLLFNLLHETEAKFEEVRRIQLLPIGVTWDDLKAERVREELLKVKVSDGAREMVKEASIADLQAQPDRKSRLRGIVTLNGEFPQQGMISVATSSDSEHTDIQLSDNGAYNIEGLTAGECIVHIRATKDGEEWRERSDRVNLREGGTTEFSYDFVDFGTLVGTVTGLAEGEAGGIFAIKGDYALTNVSEDDLYDFGDICDGEARPNKEGIFTIRELEEGKYTIIAIAERHVVGEESSFLYVTDTVEIKSGEEANISLSLN